MKIGVSSYSFRSYIKSSGCDYFELCDIAREMGFDGIEFIDLDLKDWGITSNPLRTARQLREYCEDIGLEICAYSVNAKLLLCDNIEAEIGSLMAKVEVAAALGAPIMRHEICYHPPVSGDFDYRAAIEEVSPHIRRISDYAATPGITTCTENFGMLFHSAERMQELIRSVNHPNFGLLCDIGNFLCADADPVTSVAAVAPYTVHVHAKDFLYKKGGVFPKPDRFFETAGGNLVRGTILGHGSVPVTDCLSALHRAGYDGWVVLEFEGPEENLPAIRSGLDYLRKAVEYI